MYKKDSKRRSCVPTLVSAGFIALDVVLDQHVPGIQRVYAGGTCGNVTTILSHFGWRTLPIGRLDRDAAGERVVRDMKKWDVDTKYLSLYPRAATPVVIENLRYRKSGDSYHRFAWTCPSCGVWLPSYRPVTNKSVLELKETLPKADVFFFDRVSRSSIELAKYYRKRGAWIVFEPSGTGSQRLFREALLYCHVLKYSNERMSELSGLSGTNRPLIQVETLGSEGLRYRLQNEGRRGTGWNRLRSILKEQPVDAVGAGDWCTAGFLEQLLKGVPTPDSHIEAGLVGHALEHGQALSAWSCQFVGARGGMYESSDQEIESLGCDTAYECEPSQVRPVGRRRRGTALHCLSAACNG
ncbi:MAG: carbohydrate kinase [Planctomycetota bacterium]|nr:MAG: carbohydrate kinase [Planctomycetota bacterium]REK25999.1 MAG: carbohydrate kinase [Planctomycetota bacterium]REK46886.1 MAG: carbohydrate kinase [Planctomycetota bacterium]